MKEYMVVISFDAVSSEDLSILRELPNFKRLIEGGALIKNVQSIYPSLTYPAHGTIVTGRYPCNHGVTDNTKFRLGDENPDWFWYRKHLKGDTIYDLVKKEKGFKTCSLFWPITAGANIDYNMPEIFCTKPYHNQFFMSAMAGNIKYQYKLNKKFKHIRNGIKEPELDDFITEALKYTIKNYDPNLILVHLIDVDSHRHYYGYNSSEAEEALRRHDRRLGEIIEALREKGILEQTNIIALGDHSAINVEKFIKINKLLKDEGLISVNSKGKVKDYKAISKSLDGSAYIYIKEKNDKNTKAKVQKLLEKKIKEEGPIEFILESDDIKKQGASVEAEFLVEAKKGYYFIDDLDGEFIEEVSAEEIGTISHRYKATHGYAPNKSNYGTFFIGYGKAFKKGIEKNGGRLINHGPTLAKILGVTLKNCDGEVEEDILA